MRKYAFCHIMSFLFHMVITMASDDVRKQYQELSVGNDRGFCTFSVRN